MLALFGAATLLTAVGLALAVTGAFTGKVPFLPIRGRLPAAGGALLAAALLTLAIWAGWSGPLGGTHQHTRQFPDVRRSSLTDSPLVDVANRAVGPSNRRLRERVTAAPEPMRVEEAVIWLAADDAPSPAAMRGRILADAGRIFAAVFEDERLIRIRRLRIAVTHPSGRPLRADLEPTVAVVEMDRPAYRSLGRTGLRPGDVLEAGRVRWLPPLDH